MFWSSLCKPVRNTQGGFLPKGKKEKKKKVFPLGRGKMNRDCGECNKYPTNVVQSLSSKQQISSEVLNKWPYQ